MPVKREPWSSKIRRWQRQTLDFLVRHHPALGLEERAEGFVRLFEKDLPPKSRILDIGGGWGFYHAPLETRGHHHIVLDVTRPGLQKCPAVIYDGTRIPFPDQSFDVSLFITVLHHIPDPEAVIREALRVTRGRIVVVEDVYRHAAGRAWTILRDQIYNVEFFGHPKNFRTSKQWIETFEKMGAVRVREESVYTWLSGLRIWNSVMVFDVSRVKRGNEDRKEEPLQKECEPVLLDLGDLGTARVVREGESGIKASGKLPAEIECCRDHFPDFPVLPGVLAIEIQKRLADFFWNPSVDRRTGNGIREIRSVKFSSFLKPGDAWEFQGAGKTGAEGEKVWKGRLFCGGRPAASAELVLESAGTSREE